MASLLRRASLFPRILPKPSLHRRTLMTLPTFSLEGKTCVVTGAARGLGKEFLTAFALSGAKGACVDISLDAGKSSIAAISEHVTTSSTNKPYSEGNLAPELRAYACDVRSEESVQKTWAEIVADFGKVDVVLTAAGIVENFEAENYDFADWKRMFDVNLHGSFLFAREAGKHVSDFQYSGRIVIRAG